MSDFDGPSMGETVNDFEQRLAEFREQAQSTDGPLGALFKEIAFQHQAYSERAEHHCVTLAETASVIQIIEAAINAAGWLQSNGSSSGLVEIPLGQWIEEIADQTTSEHVLPPSEELG